MATDVPPRARTMSRFCACSMPLKPYFVPVPALPGPWQTIAASQSKICFAASRAECRVTVSWSPPNACPQVSVTESRPAALRSRARRLKASGSAPASVMM